MPKPSPSGNFESARATAEGIQVKGWMAAPSSASGARNARIETGKVAVPGAGSP